MGASEVAAAARLYPRLRYMGSKHRLLPWIAEVLGGLQFDSALDAFAGSGCVSYLLKRMGKRVVSNDFLNFTHQAGLAAIENSRHRLGQRWLEVLTRANPGRERFIEDTFSGVFFTPADLRFLDNAWANMSALPTRFHRALALAALSRACVKRQPRGVFTVTGAAAGYDDGRRDLRLSIEQHFLESVEIYNAAVFDNGHGNRAIRGDVFDAPIDADLVYMDPPYVPRADDNCYIKRYHFLEGLASYWTDAGTEVQMDTASRKIAKRFTPFSYKRTAVDGFDRMFARFRASVLVLSYSSNGYPDLDVLTGLMAKYKGKVEVHERPHRYHFGTHGGVAAARSAVREYLIVGV